MWIKEVPVVYSGFPGDSGGKESVCNAGDPDLIPGLGRSPGEGNGNPLQYSCLESSFCNPMDCNPPGSSVHGILQARILEWIAIFFYRGSSQCRDRIRVLLHCRQIVYCLSHQGSHHYILFINHSITIVTCLSENECRHRSQLVSTSAWAPGSQLLPTLESTLRFSSWLAVLWVLSSMTNAVGLWEQLLKTLFSVIAHKHHHLTTTIFIFSPSLMCSALLATREYSK